MILLRFSKENPELSIYEIKSLLNIKDYSAFDNLFVAKTNFNEKAKRLACTKEAYKLLFEADEKNFERKLKKFNFTGVYKKSFSLRAHSTEKEAERKYAGIIYRKLKNPKVDLRNAETKITIFKIKNRMFCCLLLWENEEDFEARKAHKRPSLHPSSINPKLAKCIVNIADSKIITDPFCGSGGILIEAGLMKLKAIGYDIEREMLDRAKTNMDFYKIKNYRLKLQDATKINKKIIGVVTDLPYGKSSKLTGSLNNLCKSFLNILKKYKKGRAIICFPNFINHKKLVKQTGLKIEKEFSYYLHKNLTKKIVVIH